MADPTIKDLAYRGLASVLGGPVDLATMVMRPFGYNVPEQQVVGGSEWIGKQLEDVGLVSSARAPVQEFITSMAIPTPSGLAKGAALGGAALVGAVKGAGKTVPLAKAKSVEFKSISDDPVKWEIKTEDFKNFPEKFSEQVGKYKDFVFYKNKGMSDDIYEALSVVDKNKNVVADVFFGPHTTIPERLEAAVEVAPGYRRQGIASAIYDKIEEIKGKKLSPSDENTPLAKAFWENRIKQEIKQ